MQKKFVILGHHNFGLCFILDDLYEKYGPEINVDIITNFKEEDNQLKEFPFALPETKVRKIYFENWKPQNDEVYYNSLVSPGSRKKIFDLFNERFEIDVSDYGTSIHPSSTISKSVKLGHGIYVGPQSVVAPFTELNNFVFINRNSSIGHHCKIHEFANIGAGVSLASQTTVNRNAIINIGCTIFDGVEIGENSIIGAGSVVTKSIPPNVISYGSPAKVIRPIA